MEEKEVWKDVRDYGGLYRISNTGFVLSFHLFRGGKKRIIKSYINNSGYAKVGLCKNGKCCSQFVHGLVARAFVLNPHNKPNINHKDGNRLNNCFSNLEWCTQKENIGHAISMGLMPSGERQGNAKLNEFQVRVIRKCDDLYQRELASVFGVCRTAISLIKLYKRWNSASKQKSRSNKPRP